MKPFPQPNNARDEIGFKSSCWSQRYSCLKDLVWKDGRTLVRVPSYKIPQNIQLWWANKSNNTIREHNTFRVYLSYLTEMFSKYHLAFCQIYATFLKVSFHNITKICNSLVVYWASFMVLYHSKTQHHMIHLLKAYVNRFEYWVLKGI